MKGEFQVKVVYCWGWPGCGSWVQSRSDAGVIGVGERVVASCGSGDLWCPYEGVA